MNLTNQRTGNSHCGTVMDTFSRERILTLNKREWLYLFLSKWHQQTGIITTGTYSKSGVFSIHLTCSTGLSLRADSSQTGAQNLSARGSNPPATISGLQMKNFRIIGFISGTQIHGKMKYHLRWLPDKTQIKINYVKLSLNNKMNFSACLTH